MIEGQESFGKASRLTYGMVGGGLGAFIGDVHRKAIAMDGMARLVAGCFSQSFDNSLKTAEAWGVDSSRVYKTPAEMLAAEARCRDRPDFILIVAPNDLHYPVAKQAVESGFHVVCDKPLTTSGRDAEDLGRLVKSKGNLFCVTYTYTGYPIVKHMRDLVKGGEIGEVRFVTGEYAQEWLATLLEKTGQKQAAWRTDPRRAGVSNCVGDIGSHIENMISYVTGLEIESLLARLDHFGPGRVLDDNASILLNYRGGARGMYWSSQIAIGQDNGFRIRVYGTKAGLEWHQECPNYVRVSYIDRPNETVSRGRDKLSARGQSLSRVPAGHPEGYFEAFANIYTTFLTTLNKVKNKEPLTDADKDYPGVDDGIRGVRFIEKCVESSEKGAAWVNF